MCTLLAVLGLATAWPALGQVPTPEQLELLQSMSPEDRAALMEQLGLGDGATGDRNQSGDDSQGRNTNRNDSRLDSQRLRDQLKPEDKTFKPDDSVIIDIDFRKDKPPRVESLGEGVPPLTIPGEEAPKLEPLEEIELQALIDRIRARNPYLLDANGALQLPGYQPIPLAGLDETQATHRLATEPTLLKLDVKVTRLPVRKLGVAGLKPFGYDLFKDSASTFAPFNDVPVPSSYIVGPGDKLNVQLYGNQNRNLRLVVSRDGRVNFPELGPLTVGGRTFEQVTADIEGRVSRQMIGVHAAVSMGDTRSIRVLVLGEANRPGSYTISGLSTITSALYASGGVKPIGSLREVQLKRRGEVIRRLDLYDLLLNGDTSDDANLLPGDVVFIPPVNATVAIDGEVRRPAIYELKDNVNIEEAVRLAGGLTSDADPSRVVLARVNDQRQRVAIDVPITGSASRSEILRAGDSLRVLKLRPTLDSGVALDGHVFRPGIVAWQKGLRLTDVIGSVDETRPNADLGYVLIRRELPPDRRVVVLSADLSGALRDPQSDRNLVLENRDRITVFDRESGRAQLLVPLIDEMKRQSSIAFPTELVRIDGRVKYTGDYPLEPGMRVSDLLRAGGGLQDAAYGARAELTRYRVTDGSRETDLIDVDLRAVLSGDESADLVLRPFDFLNVKEVREWSVQEQIKISGEVRFPGIYPIQRDETLSSVIRRAGGLTSSAFTQGAVFTRKELQVREEEQLNRLAERMQSDLAAAALQAAAANQAHATDALSVGQSLLTQLKSAKASGRLVIDLAALTREGAGSASDLQLRDGDWLAIPKTKQEVTVIGEVQSPTSHFFREELSRDDYLALSGGTTRKGDRGRIYIVRADGTVVANESFGWFRRSGQASMRAGDTVVVPIDTERMPALPLWQAVTQILYNLAITAAAVNSF
ncbi:MAG: SLBB domain-containing protein [Steroidobacteraceae bacterium]|nr:SLBB domain-containing protein [Steroidobacteraceae bacterium]